MEELTEYTTVKLKNGGYLTGEIVIYSGNYIIVQNKEHKNGNLYTTQKIYDLKEIDSVTLVRPAETRPDVILIAEQEEKEKIL